MNDHPHFPGNISAFKELRLEDIEYFREDFFKDDSDLPLSDPDRLLFLSHFTAIGKMWDELNEILRKREEKFKKEKSIFHIDNEDEYVTLDLLIDGEKKYILTDTLGMLAETNLRHSEGDVNGSFPSQAVTIAWEYGCIWSDLERIMKTFCRCLGYEFKWDGEEFHLQGNGIKTSGFAWGNDCDSLFENLEALS